MITVHFLIDLPADVEGLTTGRHDYNDSPAYAVRVNPLNRQTLRGLGIIAPNKTIFPTIEGRSPVALFVSRAAPVGLYVRATESYEVDQWVIDEKAEESAQ